MAKIDSISNQQNPEKVDIQAIRREYEAPLREYFVSYLGRMAQMHMLKPASADEFTAQLRGVVTNPEDFRIEVEEAGLPGVKQPMKRVNVFHKSQDARNDNPIYSGEFIGI